MMPAPVRRILIPLSLLCLCGCLAEEVHSPAVKDGDPGGDKVFNTVLRKPETRTQNNTLPCYEDDLRFDPIIWRDLWTGKNNHLFRMSPMNYIVVRDGGKGCSTHEECLASVSTELRKTEDTHCSAVDNFYVGGNGEVYEGRGWNVAPYWHLNGMRKKAITVKFLGSHESEGPGERALRGFWRMVKSGVWGRRLSADYRVLSMGQVYNDSTLVGEALAKVFRESSVGIQEFSRRDTWETTPDESLMFVAREEWGAKKPSKPMDELEYGIKYVMINEGGERCLTQEDCTTRMRAEQEEQLPTYGDLIHNFYIGDDGSVYEGRGFNSKPLWDIELEPKNNNFFKADSITVRFFGKFHSEPPSEKAIGSLKLLVNAGLSLNKIPEGYKIYSLRGIYNEPHFLGDSFLQIAKKWNPWGKELDDRFAKESVKEKGLIGLVKRMDWEAKEPTEEFRKVKHPVDYIIINDNSRSDECLNAKGCISLMKKIQEKDQEGYGDVKDNFYVSDIGRVYEGRGWDTEPQFQPKYFNKSLITINFLGNQHVDIASLTTLGTFNNLIRYGVKLGKISPNYQLYSSRNIYDEKSLLSDGLYNYFVNTDKWSKKLDTLTENERLDSGLLPIISRKDWSSIHLNATYHPYTKPIQYVAIGSTGDRCFTQDKCLDVMKEVQSGKTSNNEGVTDNFYIGDDGMAYEGRGWAFAPRIYSEELKTEFYFVTFLGKYVNDAMPSKLSIYAFNRLMENGLRTGKLSHDFKIISAYQIFQSEPDTSDSLYSSIKTWDRWISEFSVTPGVEAGSSGSGIFVSREDWQAEKPLHEVPSANFPLNYILVHNVGDNCNDLSSCIKSVQKIQKNTPPRYWDLADNFYVGDDGHIYEGRGWDHSSLWATKGIENKFISVGFLGSFESNPPSKKALLAFYVLQQTGVIMGKLTPDFKTLSLGEIMKDYIVVSEKLIGALNATEYWSDTIWLKKDSARLRSLTSPFVLSDEWNHSKLPIRTSTMLSMPIKYIAIRDGGVSCDTNEDCIKRIRAEHEGRHAATSDGVAENFYIGNDGNVYEGTGWDWDMNWGFQEWRKTVSVHFFGTYENSLPSAKAIEAFNTVIIKDGIETGKLSPDYKVAPIPEGDGRSISKKLKEEVLTWKNAIEDIENEG